MDWQLLFLTVAIVFLITIYGALSLVVAGIVAALVAAVSRFTKRWLSALGLASPPRDFFAEYDVAVRAISRLAALIGLIYLGGCIGLFASLPLGYNHGSLEENMREIYGAFGGALGGIIVALFLDYRSGLKQRQR